MDYAIDEEFNFSGGTAFISYEGAAGVQLHMQRPTTKTWVPITSCGAGPIEFTGDGATTLTVPVGRLRFSVGTWTSGGISGQ